MQHPIVSVILPIYNVEKYLGKCIDSILNQTLEDIEIICVDDGSTDDSIEIIKKYIQIDPRIILVTQEHGGAGKARNKGLDIAKGEYLAFLDSDDFFEKNMLEDSVKICKTENCDFVFFKVKTYDEKNGTTDEAKWIIKDESLPKKQSFHYRELKDNIFTFSHTCAWNKLYRSSFIKKNKLRFQDLPNTNDLYFVCMSIILANKISYLPKCLYTYRINNENSLSAGKERNKNFASAYMAFNKLRNSLTNMKLYDEVKCSYINMCVDVYAYNLQRTTGIEELAFKIKLATSWLKELDINEKPLSYFKRPDNAQKMFSLLNTKMFSFDIFDTLITRKVALPKGVFYEIQDQLSSEKKYTDFPKFIKQNFVSIRTSTELFMYKYVCTKEIQDITFEEIYARIQKQYNLDDWIINELKKLEQETEEKSFVPVESTISLIKELVTKKKKVVLISDMYFPSNIIKKWLIKIDPVFSNLPIYVSADWSRKKQNGELFKVVSVHEKVSYNNWIHFGDNYRCDYEMPRLLGIDSIHFNFPQLKSYEKNILEKKEFDCSIQRAIGKIRNMRLKYNGTPKFEFGFSFSGIILCEYINWLIETSVVQGIDMLVFIARDGYVLKNIADIYIREKKINLKTKYIFGSREAWKTPYTIYDKEKISTIVKYLRKEMNFSSPFAFVEYMGTGETIDCITKIMAEYMNLLPVTSFYLYHSRDTLKQFAKKNMMYPLNEHFNPILELLVRAPYGQTTGYTEENGIIFPVLDEKEGKELKKYGYDEYVHGVCAFAELYSNTLPEFDSIKGNWTMVLFYLNFLSHINMIDQETADILGAIPFKLDGIVNQVTEYAPLISKSEYEKYLSGENVNYNGTNLELSIVRSGYKLIDSSTLNEIKLLKQKIKQSQMELLQIKSSEALVYGEKMVFFRDKFKRLIQCCKDHGIMYTFCYGVRKIKRQLC